jgi:hypothetical protein
MRINKLLYPNITICKHLFDVTFLSFVREGEIDKKSALEFTFYCGTEALVSPLRLLCVCPEVLLCIVKVLFRVMSSEVETSLPANNKISPLQKFVETQKYFLGTPLHNGNTSAVFPIDGRRKNTQP